MNTRRARRKARKAAMRKVPSHIEASGRRHGSVQRKWRRKRDRRHAQIRRSLLSGERGPSYEEAA